MSWVITCNKIESLKKDFPINKSSGPDGVMHEFYQTSAEVTEKAFSNYPKKIKEKRKLLNSF